ncbi:hypothetical protein ACQRXC_14920 [Niallia taxi]|uniref:hypothetical protein n=1 Tax=Niallia taxi TaxID=2499688 RepID=UPI003F626F40
MGVSVSGNSQLERELMRLLGSQRTQQIVDRALLAGANVFVQELKQQFQSFKDTGASIAEITISQPMNIGGARSVQVFWRGPKERYRVIHLNEWGTVNNPNPEGKGAIARALRNAEQAYRNAIKQELRRGL